MNSQVRIDTESATPTTIDATTEELVAIHDIAGTLADVLTGMAQAPRCTGPAEAWAASLLEALHGAREAVAAALLKRTDQNQMRAVALAQSLETAMEDDHSDAILMVIRDVASRASIG